MVAFSIAAITWMNIMGAHFLGDWGGCPIIGYCLYHALADEEMILQIDRNRTAIGPERIERAFHLRGWRDGWGASRPVNSGCRRGNSSLSLDKGGSYG